MLYFLIGYMASGKSTVAKKIKGLNSSKISVIDLDDLIELHENMTVAEIFSEKGEKHFRNIEHLALLDIIHNDVHGETTVIACGGGTPLYNDNMNLMLNNGIVIYLKCQPSTILERLSQEEIQKRPLLCNSNDVKKTIEEDIKMREKYYNKANIIINYETINIKWP